MLRMHSNVALLHRFVIAPLIMVVLFMDWSPYVVHAADACSISGRDYVCCENNGLGPLCAKCTTQCIRNIKDRAASCDMSADNCTASTNCTNVLTTKSIASGFTFEGDDYHSLRSWTGGTSNENEDFTPYFFSNSQLSRCPGFGCYLRLAGSSDDNWSTTYSKYGI